MQFHEKLQMLRKEKRLSQEDLAELLDVTRQSVSKWESGQTYPETDKIIAISEIFGVTLDSLLKDSETANDANNTRSEPFWQTRGSYYEYRSEREAFGRPLVHINIGLRPRKARGVIAIGNIAHGFISIGLLSMGLLSIGLLSLGLVGIGLLSIALLLAVGSIAVGGISIGAVAFGVVTLGAVSIGMYSIGAVAVASHVAVGDHAYAPIAIGRVARGVQVFIDTSAARDFSTISGEEVRTAIMTEFPDTWNWVVNWMTWFLGQ